MPLIGNHQILRGEFVVAANKDNPMAFINTNPVWGDWDLVYMPEESYDEAHEEICATVSASISNQ